MGGRGRRRGEHAGPAPGTGCPRHIRRRAPARLLVGRPPARPDGGTCCGSSPRPPGSPRRRPRQPSWSRPRPVGPCPCRRRCTAPASGHGRVNSAGTNLLGAVGGRPVACDDHPMAVDTARARDRAMPRPTTSATSSDGSATTSARRSFASRARTSWTSWSRSAAPPRTCRAPVTPGDLRTHLGSLDLPTGIRLARAFSSYFHLANLAEQVHRVGARAPLGAPGLPFVPRLPGGSELDPGVRRAGSRRSTCGRCSPPIRPRRPGGRSPTSAARSPTSSPTAPTRGPPTPTVARIDRHVGEAIDLLWQTDELRSQRPTPIDEAGAVLAVLDDLAANVVRTLLEDVRRRACAPAGVEPDPTAASDSVRHLGRRRP